MIKLEMKNYSMILIDNIPILPSNKKQIIEQAKFTYYLLWKAFEKQTKTIEHQGKNKSML